VKFLHKISLPLLQKELVEQANRKRTYVIRVVFALGMALVFIMVMNDTVSNSGVVNLWSLASAGKNILTAIIFCLYVITLLVLPGAAATSITSERERGSLELLLVTKLGPWKIVLQKFLGRVIPVAMFAFLCLPMAAVAYSFGGTNQQEIAYFAAELAFLIVFVAACGTFFSAWFANGVTAIIATYLTVGATATVFIVFVPKSYVYSFEEYLTQWFVWQVIASSLALTLATLILKLRRQPRKGNTMLRIFKRLDRFWKKLNDRFLGGMEIITSDKEQLPGKDPIAWFEKYKRASGTTTHLTRIIVILLVPVSILLLLVILTVLHEGRIAGTLEFLEFSKFTTAWFGIYLAVAALTLLAKGVSIVSEERRNQTLEILLTTPVSPEHLLKIKAKTLQRTHLAFAIPIGILTAITAAANNMHPISVVIIFTILYFVHLKALTWGAVWLGLRIKNQRKAFVLAFTILAVWLFLPPIISETFSPYLSRAYYIAGASNFSFTEAIFLISPLDLILSMISPPYYLALSPLEQTIISAVPALAAYLYFKISLWGAADRLLRK
jgi:ABC-type transport system involved in multi-copper enzyme maturation permease subunit